MILSLIFSVLVLTLAQALPWHNPSSIPSGHRSQFYVQQKSGDYKYGYDTGAGFGAQQTANAVNQVDGYYFYTDPLGQQRNLKYTSGVQGFVPVELARAQENSELDPDDVPTASDESDPSGEYVPDNSGEYVPDNSGEYVPDNSGEYQPDPNEESGDESGHEDGSEPRHESGPEPGHENGPEPGHENGPEPGHENGPEPGQRNVPTPSYPEEASDNPNRETLDRVKSSLRSKDASYAFNFDTPTYKRTESADPNGKVEGSYSYSNPSGTHSLQYTAGANKGFVAKSGSLSVPNGLAVRQQAALNPASHGSVKMGKDGSYSFEYVAPDHERKEAADAHGNVRGRYSYQNSAGTHDLTYVAGSATGFLPTGGSLVAAPGLPSGQLRTGYVGSHGAPARPEIMGRALQHPSVNSYTLGNVKVVTFLPLYGDKYGYILDTTY